MSNLYMMPFWTRRERGSKKKILGFTPTEAGTRAPAEHGSHPGRGEEVEISGSVELLGTQRSHLILPMALGGEPGDTPTSQKAPTCLACPGGQVDIRRPLPTSLAPCALPCVTAALTVTCRLSGTSVTGLVAGLTTSCRRRPWPQAGCPSGLSRVSSKTD